VSGRAYYNEREPYAAQWLRNLIAAGHIAPGDVDDRDILDVRPGDLAGYTQCHFFAGVGVWSLALRRAGWADDRRVWTGSCPCQPFSQAGEGLAFDDKRHLWPAWFHLIAQCQPPVIFGEQVASKDALPWIDLVQSVLEAADYAVGTADLCAAGVGAPHIRQRLWFVADASSPGLSQRERPFVPGPLGNDEGRATEQRGGALGSGRPGAINGGWSAADWIYCRDGRWRPVEPGTFPLADGAPSRVGRLRAYGNAIVAQVAETFIGAYLDLNP
jgi:DNA (cytosine-5)-methyltransferase 1